MLPETTMPGLALLTIQPRGKEDDAVLVLQGKGLKGRACERVLALSLDLKNAFYLFRDDVEGSSVCANSMRWDGRVQEEEVPHREA